MLSFDISYIFHYEIPGDPSQGLWLSFTSFSDGLYSFLLHCRFSCEFWASISSPLQNLKISWETSLFQDQEVKDTYHTGGKCYTLLIPRSDGFSWRG